MGIFYLKILCGKQLSKFLIPVFSRVSGKCNQKEKNSSFPSAGEGSRQWKICAKSFQEHVPTDPCVSASMLV